MKRIILNIGEIAVSREPAKLETILGSCVALCLWDEARRIGGLNHYLLPHEQPNSPKSTVYGATCIDALVGRMTKAGAEIPTLQARIYGGGSVIAELDDLFSIGMDNVRIAREKLAEYGIPVVATHVRARQGIRVVFETSTGEVTVKPLGSEIAVGFPGKQPGMASKQLQPCKSCIMCGSCEDLRERRRRNKMAGI
jgi:chemotaxis protein CheD